MTDESATSTYLIPEPFDRAVKFLREVLAEGNLRITGELNMSGRIQKMLLVGTAPCLVLFACFGGAAALGDCEAVMTPLHIVISARGANTEVHILRAMPRDGGPLDRTTLNALARLQAAISRAVGKIGMRVGVGA